MILTLYIKLKNLSYIFIHSKWNSGGTSNSNVVINNYNGGSKIIKKILVRFRKILSVLIIIIIILLDVIIPILDIVEYLLDIVTLFI